jgi:hypothetical protein
MFSPKKIVQMSRMNEKLVTIIREMQIKTTVRYNF